ncbi:DMT family transporter [Staphylospora marina]|uniref:DMT family transporter n=1 Tax=Staphylospora marina TaxID=2490858 RepID=UPI000F5BBE8A|nr:DMT family transporter [Staphylospora marina]
MRFFTRNMLNALGPLQVASAAVIWGSIGLFVNRIPLPAMTITFFRVFVAAVSIFMILLLTASLKSLVLKDRKTVWLVFLMSLFYTFNWVLFIQALKLTTITNAVLSYYTAPAFMAVLGWIFLKERLDLKGLFFIALSFFGLYLVFIPETSGGTSHMTGLMYGVAAGFVYALAVVTSKAIKESLDSWTMAFFQTGIGTLVLLPFVIFEIGNPLTIQLDVTGWMFLVIIGLVHTTVALALFFSGIRSISAKQVGLIMYLDPLSAVFFSKVVLNERIDVYTIAGGILILVSGILSVLAEERNKKNEGGSPVTLNE